MRDMVKLIHADNFFKGDEAEQCRWALEGMQFVEGNYGMEIPNFQMVFSGVDEAFSHAVGEKLTVVKEDSGKFKRPFRSIHFESFDGLNEWCFVIALQRTTFNIYHHVKDYSVDIDIVDAKSALEGYQFNYKNLFEWKVNTNIELEPNQGVFFRPWCFHSLDGGMVQYYRLKSEGAMHDLPEGEIHE